MKFMLHFHTSPSCYISLVVRLIEIIRTSSDINFRLLSGKSLNKLLGWPQPTARSPQPAARSPQPAARSPQLDFSKYSSFLHLCNLIPFWVMTNFFVRRWVWPSHVHRHPCNLCIGSLYESGKQCWVQSLPPKCSNIYVANITILNSIT